MIETLSQCGMRMRDTFRRIGSRCSLICLSSSFLFDSGNWKLDRRQMRMKSEVERKNCFSSHLISLHLKWLTEAFTMTNDLMQMKAKLIQMNQKWEFHLKPFDFSFHFKWTSIVCLSAEAQKSLVRSYTRKR